MSNKNKNKFNKLQTQPNRMSDNKPQITESVISGVKSEITNQLITEPVTKPVVTEAPVEKKNISQKYIIVSIRGDVQLFQNEVTKFINDGWKLAGGIATSMYMDGYTAIPIWTQALTKEFSN